MDSAQDFSHFSCHLRESVLVNCPGSPSYPQALSPRNAIAPIAAGGQHMDALHSNYLLSFTWGLFFWRFFAVVAVCLWEKSNASNTCSVT